MSAGTDPSRPHFVNRTVRQWDLPALFHLCRNSTWRYARFPSNRDVYSLVGLHHFTPETGCVLIHRKDYTQELEFALRTQRPQFLGLTLRKDCVTLPLPRVQFPLERTA